MKKGLFFVFVLMIGMVALFSVLPKSEKQIYNVNTAQFITNSEGEAIELLLEHQQGIYYFGFSACPWCVELLPIFDTVLNQNNQQAYVIDTRSESYNQNLDEKMIDFLGGDFSVPLVIFVNSSGEIQSHSGTIEGHDAKVKNLSKEEQGVLAQLLDESVNWAYASP